MIYTFAAVFATWGVVYHYNVWLEKPPTRVVLGRGWQLLRQQGVLAEPRTVCRATGRHSSGLQTFIRKRSRCAGGCTSASSGVACWRWRSRSRWCFGWIHFGSAPDDQMTYVTYLFGFPAGSFRLRTRRLVVPVSRARHRRGAGAGGHRAVAVAADARSGSAGRAVVRDGFLPADPAVRNFGHGPCADRLDRVAARQLLRFLAILHAMTVVTALLYLPFGKFFHIFQRPAQTRRQALPGGGRSGRGRALRPLRRALRLADAHRRSEAACCRELGFDYAMPGQPALAGPLSGLQAQDARDRATCE